MEEPSRLSTVMVAPFENAVFLVRVVPQVYAV